MSYSSPHAISPVPGVRRIPRDDAQCIMWSTGYPVAIPNSTTLQGVQGVSAPNASSYLPSDITLRRPQTNGV